MDRRERRGVKSKEVIEMPIFTQKHHAKIAEVLSKIEYYQVTKIWIAQELAKMFKEDNPRFDAEKFLKASRLGIF